MTERSFVRVAVNDFGVVVECVADAVCLQDGAELIGVCDVASEWRLRSLEQKGIALYATSDETLRTMTEASLTITDTVLQSSRKLEGSPRRLLAETNKAKS